MSILIDISIIAIIVLSTFFAYRKGLVNLAIGLCTFLISILITFILYQPISNLIIQTTSIDETIENAIYEKANNLMQENKEGDDITSQVIETTKNKMLPETARMIAINLVRAGVIVVLLVGSKLALRCVKALTGIITKVPGIHQVNQLGGVVYGLIRGIIIVYVLLLICIIPGQITPKNSVNESIEQSILGKVMYDNNILKVFFPSDL